MRFYIEKLKIETKLRSFQIKLNLRAVVTNIVLHGLEITTTDKCTFCDAEKETLLHLFCTCLKVASFWENFSSWIESKLKYRLMCYLVLNVIINFTQSLIVCYHMLECILIANVRLWSAAHAITQPKTNIVAKLVALSSTRKENHYTVANHNDGI